MALRSKHGASPWAASRGEHRPQGSCSARRPQRSFSLGSWSGTLAPSPEELGLKTLRRTSEAPTQAGTVCCSAGAFLLLRDPPPPCTCSSGPLLCSQPWVPRSPLLPAGEVTAREPQAQLGPGLPQRAAVTRGPQALLQRLGALNMTGTGELQWRRAVGSPAHSGLERGTRGPQAPSREPGFPSLTPSLSKLPGRIELLFCL